MKSKRKKEVVVHLLTLEYKSPCGSEEDEDVLTIRWKEVTCKKCLRFKPKKELQVPSGWP